MVTIRNCKLPGNPEVLNKLGGELVFVGTSLTSKGMGKGKVQGQGKGNGKGKGKGKGIGNGNGKE